MNEFIKVGDGYVRKSSVSSINKLEFSREPKYRIVVTFDKHFLYEDFDTLADRDVRFAEIEQELCAQPHQGAST